MKSPRIVCTAILAATLGVAGERPASGQPPAPVRGPVSGEVLGGALTFAWTAVPTATWYHLMIQDPDGVKLDSWFTSDEAQCGGGVASCQVGVNVLLARGVVHWWVQAYSPAGYSQWSTRGDFNAAGLLHADGALRNTFVGIDAGNSSTEASAVDNTAVGSAALSANRQGPGNTAIGRLALASNSSGAFNTAIGRNALGANTTGTSNVAVGTSALRDNVIGDHSVAVGVLALSVSDASENTAVGTLALGSTTTGTGNVAIGHHAGKNQTTGSNNIYADHPGVAGESNTIRIGQGHTAAFVAGIHGQTSANGINVLVNSSGRLGTTTSSARFKEDIRDVGDATAALAKLRPVEFRYRASLDPDRITQYGLIAEEVAQVWPELVVYDAEGRPETVRYHLLVPLLLNELQKQQQEIQRLTERMNELQRAREP